VTWLGNITANVTAANAAITILDANIGTLFLGNASTQANIGAYQTYANANIGSIYNRLNTLDANVGAFELYANANVGSIYNQLNTLDANVGAYQIYSNANAAAQAVSLDTINANIGAFYTYANSKIGTNNNSNLVIASTTESVSAITGALVVAGGVGVGGNLYVTGNIYASNLTAISISTLSVVDPLLYLTASNPFPYNYDIGFFSHYSRVSGDERHTGLARDYTTNTWNFFSNVDSNLFP
jgi:hypothetical protein